MKGMKLRAYWPNREPQLGICEVVAIDFREGTAQISNGSVLVFPQLSEIELLRPTGLKDRHGAEVWEGDVIRWANAPSIHFRWRVDYSENEAMFFATSLDGYSGGSLQGIAAQGGIEVIGNVFQHPHLLERP